MNIVFIDPIAWDYDVSTPYEKPLGGSQSALCYLTAELVRRGHRVTLLNGTTALRTERGVTCLSLRQVPADFFDPSHDVVVVLNHAEICLHLRGQLAANVPLVLWNQHANDQPAVQPLRRPEVQRVWDAIVCVSDWHRQSMISCFGLEPARVLVLRNAIGPAFENLFADAEALVRSKKERLFLAYTSTPFRGLDVLLSVFPEVHREFPDVILRVYSSMKVYNQTEEKDDFRHLYDRCRSTPGVEYVGSVAQSRLAEELTTASILSYPNTFAETSCIAVMEARAAGAFVVTSELGVLPETTMGFGVLVPTSREFPRNYLASLVGVVRRHAMDPAAFARERFEQVRTITTCCTWPVRALEWEEAITTLKSGLSHPLAAARSNEKGKPTMQANLPPRPGMPTGKTTTAKFDYSGGSRPIELFDTALGRQMCQEVLTGVSYPLLRHIANVETVVDIGANIGAAAVFFASHYPRARVIAFEPSPNSYALLLRNTQGLSDVAIYNVGLADRDQTGVLFQSHFDPVTDSLQSSPLNSTVGVDVESRDAHAVFEELELGDIDILKLDTEGCEVTILRALSHWIPRIGALYVEYHDADDRLAIDELMAATHVLCWGKISSPHRGELCYLARSRFPSQAIYDELRIKH